jgi:hypothetical protein
VLLPKLGELIFLSSRSESKADSFRSFLDTHSQTEILSSLKPLTLLTTYQEEETPKEHLPKLKHKKLQR